MPHHQFQACIEACNTCAAACSHCAMSCLQEAHVQHMRRCIQLDIDCAEFCRMAAAVMSRGSEFAEKICAVCADICEACARECGQHANEHCQACAEACRLCAQECRKMAA